MSIMTNEDKDALIVHLRERINLFELRLKDTVRAAHRIVAEKDQRIMALKEELEGMLSVNDNANRRIAELTEVLSDIVLGTPIDDCNRNDDGLNAHPRNMERRIERTKSILKKEGDKW